MACCAFAAFIIGQIVLGLDAWRTAVFGPSRSAPARDRAVAWSLAVASAPLRPSARPRGMRPLARAVACASVLELAILGVAALGWPAVATPHPDAFETTSPICGWPHPGQLAALELPTSTGGGSLSWR
jgi:hypothetical protein